ncbi:Predicted PurR-regulated permease PerM [Parapedobacter composti]|uniref:Predicted PurR-regulated permease PerM n=1 Tax=Parapedobacter composti TaxID=623281 RepID=A0A1I1ECY9_9SPHI|nr:AI-2E family transporter [Parapedobacter composti]SFB84917.1 Predicted PurR-regulated permease PerM [Parapedobacter composti]
MPGGTNGSAATTTRTANIILIITLSIASLYFAASFLIPVVLAGLLAMLLNGASEWLEKLGLGRALSAFIPVLAFIGAITVIGLVLSWQINRLTADFAGMKEQVGAKLEALRAWVSDTFGIAVHEQEKLVKEQGKEASNQAGTWLFTIVNTLADVAVNTVLVVVYTYLLIFYRSHLKKAIIHMVPESKKRDTNRIIHKSIAVSGHYLIGLFAMVACLWVMYGIGFTIIGLQGAILFAMICGLLEIVPFLGNFVGSVIALIAALAQGGDAGMVLGVVAVYVIVQFLQTYILEPLVVGQRVNINPLFTIMGLVAGELLWGIAGMALAIPVVGIIKIICDNVPELKPYGILIGPADSPKGKTHHFQALKRKFERK